MRAQDGSITHGQTPANTQYEFTPPPRYGVAGVIMKAPTSSVI